MTSDWVSPFYQLIVNNDINRQHELVLIRPRYVIIPAYDDVWEEAYYYIWVEDFSLL